VAIINTSSKPLCNQRRLACLTTFNSTVSDSLHHITLSYVVSFHVKWLLICWQHQPHRPL